MNKAFAEQVTEVAQQVAIVPEQPFYMQFLPIIFIFIIFYFLLIRPQMKKQKEQQALINSLKKGDKVVFAGGLVGTFVKDEEDGLAEIELAKDLKVKVLKPTITSMLSKPVTAEDKPKKSKKA